VILGLLKTLKSKGKTSSDGYVYGLARKRWNPVSVSRFSQKHDTMWANAQRDCRPVEYRWRPLFNAVNFGWRSDAQYGNAVQ